MHINKWFPVHLHTLPAALENFSLAGAIISIEWKPEQLGKYYNWQGEDWPGGHAESIMAFLRNWKKLSAKTPFEDHTNVFFSIEGIISIGDLSLLSKMKKMGLIAFQLFHWIENQYYSPHKGITQKGKELLKAIEKNKIYLDLSHLNGSGLLHVLDNFSGKKIVSHVVCEDLLEWNLMRRSNSMTAKELKLCNAELYGIPFIDDLVSPNSSLTPTHRKAAVRTVAEHLNHLANIVGVNRATLGPDYFDYQIVQNVLNVEVETVKGLDTVQGLQELGNTLAKLGYSFSDIQNIFWRNAANLFCR
jgi:membrane dipeptidase